MINPLHDNSEHKQPQSPTSIIDEHNPFSSDPELLNRDLPCRSCGYNLRGLMTEGRCPECGAAVVDSLNENLLRYSLPTLVHRLYYGVKLVYSSVLWPIYSFLIMWIVWSLMELLVWNLQITIPPSAIYIILGIFLLPALAFPILYPLGWWWATTPDPIDDPKMRRQRVILRWTAIGFILVVPLWVSIYTYGFMASPTGSIFSQPNLLREIITHAFFIIVWFHLYAMNYFMSDAMNRCAPNVKHTKFKKHIRALSSNRKWIRNFSVVLLAFHWIGMISHYWVLPMKGFPTGGTTFGSGIGYFWMMLLWVVTIGMLAYITTPLLDEYLIAQGFHDDKMESNQP